MGRIQSEWYQKNEEKKRRERKETEEKRGKTQGWGEDEDLREKEGKKEIDK